MTKFILMLFGLAFGNHNNNAPCDRNQDTTTIQTANNLETGLNLNTGTGGGGDTGGDTIQVPPKK